MNAPAASRTLCILATGNPADGFEFIGPFLDREEANTAGDSVNGEWWVIELKAPDKDALERIGRMTDSDALDAIAQRLSGTVYDDSIGGDVGDIVMKTGRTIEDYS